MPNKIRETSRFLRKFNNGYIDEGRACLIMPGNIMGYPRAEIDSEGSVEVFEGSYVVEVNEDEVNDDIIKNYQLLITKRVADQLTVHKGKLYFIIPPKNLRLINFKLREVQE